MKSKSIQKKSKNFITENYITIILTGILVLSFLFFLSAMGNNNVYGDGEVEYIFVTVKAGDSLWEIAEDHTSNHRDIRETIIKIKRMNDLSSDILFVGDILKIPVSYK